jgi:hypothetical protein
MLLSPAILCTIVHPLRCRRSTGAQQIHFDYNSIMGCDVFLVLDIIRVSRSILSSQDEFIARLTYRGSLLSHSSVYVDTLMSSDSSCGTAMTHNRTASYLWFPQRILYPYCQASPHEGETLQQPLDAHYHSDLF